MIRLVIDGPERMGKSSLARYAVQNLKKLNFICEYRHAGTSYTQKRDTANFLDFAVKFYAYKNANVDFIIFDRGPIAELVYWLFYKRNFTILEPYISPLVQCLMDFDGYIDFLLDNDMLNTDAVETYYKRFHVDKPYMNHIQEGAMHRAHKSIFHINNMFIDFQDSFYNYLFKHGKKS